jgi:putative membrane protein
VTDRPLPDGPAGGARDLGAGGPGETRTAYRGVQPTSLVAGSPPTITRPEAVSGSWHRLHPLSPVIRGGRSLIPLVVVLAPAALGLDARSGGSGGGGGEFSGHAVDLAVAAIVIMLGVVSWIVTRWRIEDGALRIETGLLRRSSQRYPLSQVQAIDTVRPALARAFGLAELRVRMGGATGGHGRLAYLTVYDADVLRARLLALAHGVDEDEPPPPERVLVSVPPGRLAWSILLSRAGLASLAVVVGLIAGAFASPDTVRPLIGVFFLPIVATLAISWRRFNADYRLTVAEAPDGLRLRAGLLETVAETIPAGRVQAVRLTEPLLWRALGWCRLEVDVAGKERRHGQDQAASRPLRPVLPVGPRVDADWLLERILPEAAEALAAARRPAGRPPRRARLKAPLRYRYLSWGHTATCVATTTGRVTRTTAWVPLGKIQSLRWVDGPVQRRLGLATVHLDTAGRNVRAALRDRDAAEAEVALGELTERARAARRARTPAR